MISVIIPTLDEELLLPACLAALAGQSAHELIVVDGGSSDSTRAIAGSAGARLVSAGRGRAAQLSAGAAAARGDVLLFLHADTRLPPGALARIECALADDPRVVGGCFTLRFDDPALSCRLMAFVGNLLLRLTRTQYGDRAMFARRPAFARVGGFRQLAIMEDVDLSRRLRRAGRTVVLPGPVTTSSREFRRQGAARLVAKIVVALGAFRLGVSPQWIRRFYYGPEGAGQRPAEASSGKAAPKAGARGDRRATPVNP